MARLEHDPARVADLNTHALLTVNAPSGWQERAAALVRDAILRTSPAESSYYVWSDVLRRLPLPRDDRHRLIEALLPHLDDESVVDSDAVLQLVDSLGPTAEQTEVIHDSLLDRLASSSVYQAPRIASELRRRGLSAAQRRAAVGTLLDKLEGARVKGHSALLEAVAEFEPEVDQQRAAVNATVGLLAWTFEPDPMGAEDEEQTVARAQYLRDELYTTLAKLGELDEADMGFVLDAMLADILGGAWVSDRTLPLLMQFGFDGLALKEFAGAASGYSDDDEFQAEPILRTLAAALRRETDVKTWQQWLPQWAEVHPALYGAP